MVTSSPQFRRDRGNLFWLSLKVGCLLKRQRRQPPASDYYKLFLSSTRCVICASTTLLEGYIAVNDYKKREIWHEVNYGPTLMLS
jgi:hypothetical protein